MRLGLWPLRVSGGFVLSYPWFALCISFGCYVLRWLRFILSLVRARCWFGRSDFAVVPSYDIVGSREMLVSDDPLGGCFVLSYSLYALSVGFGRSTFAAVSPYHIIGSP